MELTIEYELRSYLNTMGFGAGVIQYLCKTSVKKNLYWEIKEKVLEERFEGSRRVTRPQRVRVYGLDSTAAVRSRLIDILHERVRYHKDKFVAPIILEEMKHMVVKKSGKVEHADNSHDDQVFSYLMALYVWYDGKNLAENFRITKNTIRTDEDVELYDNDVEENVKELGEVNFDNAIYDEDSEIAQALDFIEKNSKFITTKDMHEKQYYEIINARNRILSKNKAVREKFAAETGVDPSMFEDNAFGPGTVDLPQALFDMDVDPDSLDDYGNPRYHVVQGNLSSMWDQV